MSVNNSKSLKPYSGDDLTPVESLADIPPVLLEIEGDLEQFERELQIVAEAQPELAAVMGVMAERMTLNLGKLATIRAFALTPQM